MPLPSRRHGLRARILWSRCPERSRAATGYIGRPRSGRAPWHALAGRAEIARSVRERDLADRRATTGTRLASSSVDVQRAVEVAALAVDVDVERVEKRAAHADRVGEHRPDLAQQPSDQRT